MSYTNVEINPLRRYLIGTAKWAAKRMRQDSPPSTHSVRLDRIAVLAGRPNWSVLARHIDRADGDELARIARKLCPRFRSWGFADFDGAEDLMRDWATRTFTPLIDFAYYDKESGNGYAWPSVELADELYGEFAEICSDELIESVARTLEASNGPWGIEDYGRTAADD